MAGVEGAKALVPERTEGLFVVGSFAGCKSSTFDGKNDEKVAKAVCYVQTDPQYPAAKCEAVGDGAAVLVGMCEGVKPGERIAVPVYVNTKGKYPALRVLFPSQG